MALIWGSWKKGGAYGQKRGHNANIGGIQQSTVNLQAWRKQETLSIVYNVFNVSFLYIFICLPPSPIPFDPALSTRAEIVPMGTVHTTVKPTDRTNKNTAEFGSLKWAVSLTDTPAGSMLAARQSSYQLNITPLGNSSKFCGFIDPWIILFSNISCGIVHSIYCHFTTKPTPPRFHFYRKLL